MPLVWKFDPANHLSVAVAIGDVTRPEVERYLDAIVESETLTYRKVFDVHLGDTSMTADDLFPLAVRIRSLHESGKMGPFAVVLPQGRGKRLQRTLGMLASAERPMRIFDNPQLAYRWLAKQDIPSATTVNSDVKGTREWSANARTLATHIRNLASVAGEEAREMPSEENDEILYRGQADIMHQGIPLNICVKRVGSSWEFVCCRADRMTLGTVLTLAAEEIGSSLSQGQDPLEKTLKQIKALAHAGALAIQDVPSGVF